MTEFKAMRTTIVSLQEEPVSAELVYFTRECAEKFEIDLANLQTSFIEFSVRVIVGIQEEKEKQMKYVGGSRASHKWVLGSC